MSNTEELGIRLNAAGVPETTSGIDLAAGATENLGKKADGAKAPLDRHNQSMERAGVSARQTAAAWRMLPAQISDITTQLAAGTPVWMVAIQQGPQIKDSFGGVGPMFREMAAALTVGRVAMGGAALGAVALVAGYAQGRRETHAFTRAITMNANAAGTNARELDAMAAGASRVVGTHGKASDALAELVATGEVARANLQAFTVTAVNMERDLDQPLADTAANFEALGRAPLEASLRLNRGLNYLTAATYDHIRALQAEGRFAEAATVAQQAYAAAMDQRTAQIRKDMTIVEMAWRSAADTAKEGWDAFVDNLRPARWREKVQEVREGVGVLQRLMGLMQGGAGAQAAWSHAQAASDNKGAEDAAAVARRKQELRERERANIEAGIAVDMARAQATAGQRGALAAQDLARTQATSTRRQSLLAAEQAALEDLRNRDAVSLADYYQRRAQLEARGLALEIANVDAEVTAAQRQAAARRGALDAQIAAENRRQPENPAEIAQQQARLLELTGQRAALEVDTETRVIELRSRRGQLVAQQAETELAAQRAIANASADATERYLDDLERRRQALVQLNSQQAQANASMAVELIADPYARATERARREIDELNRYYDEQLAGLRARLPGLQTSDPTQAAVVRTQIAIAEQQKNDAIVLRARQLTDDLKPEWQRQLEGWRDHTRLMRETFDEFQDGWLSAGRAAWADYMRTGRLSLDSLGRLAVQQVGDQVFKQVIAEPFSKVGQGVAGLLGLGGASGGAETAARALNTSSLQANTLALTQVAAALGVQTAGNGATSVAGMAGNIGGSVWEKLGDWAQLFFTSSGWGPGLASGGPARAGSLHEVNERGPELLTVNNRTYLMMGGKDGFVTPNGRPSGGGGGGASGSTTVVLSPNIHIDSRTDAAQIGTLVQKAMRTAQVELLDMMARRQA